MGSTQASSGSYPYFVATAKIVNTEVPELAVTVAESGASVENVNRMAQGTFQLGQASTDIIYKALNGLDQWAGKAVPDLRVLWVYDITAQAFVVREDSGVKKPEDLDGRDFNPGMRGSATETLARATLGILGIKPKLYVAGTEDAVAAIKDKRIVGYVKGTSASVIDPTILDVSVNSPIRLLAFSKAQLEKTLAAHPYFSTTEIPAGIYKGDWNAQPVPMLAQVQAMAVRANDLSEDQAYRVTKAVVEDNRPGGKGLQAAARPAIRGVDLAKQTIDNSLTPLHAGAQRYFAEIGLTISDRLRSPEVK